MTELLTRASDIAVALQTRLLLCNGIAPYETEIGARVFRGRRNVGEEVVPCTVLLEGADTAESTVGRSGVTAKIVQRYTIGAYLPCDPDHPNDAAHAAIRDIKRAVFGDGGRLGGAVHTVLYKGRDIGARADGVAIVFVTVDIDVTYVENLSAP